jgi:hypothetical protein
MNSKPILIVAFILISYSFTSSSENQKSTQLIKAYIQKIRLDSISIRGLLNDNTIRFTKPGIKITQAVAYFDKGSFKSVQQQIFTGNKLGFLGDSWIVNAKTPYRITIGDIRYIDSKGKRGLAEEFSFIVY